jgi:serine protease Do
MKKLARHSYLISVLLILSIALSACQSPFDDNDDDPDSTPAPVAAATGTPGSAQSTPTGNDDATVALDGDFTGAVARVTDAVRPAVVFLSVVQTTTGMFGQEEEQEGVGSGFIIDEDGHILTNNHVVAGADTITVILPDGREFEGNVLGRSRNPDVALIQIDGEDLPVVELGQSSELEIGEWVVAIGNALGLQGGPTVTAGVVGALDRTLRPARDAPPMENLIQLDAAINPGNSGGPLVNLAGEVVGINTAGIRGAEGIGFAVAIEDAQNIVEQILEGEPRAALGVSGASVTPAIASQLGLEVNEGVVVVEVQSDSGAEAAGIQPGDVITSVDGQDITGTSDLRDVIAEHEPDDTVTVTVDRQGEELELDVTLGESEVVQ